jgi:hypothetical protein
VGASSLLLVKYGAFQFRLHDTSSMLM